MAVRPILTYPHPLLRKSCEPVTPEQLATSEFQALIADMIETLYAHPGAVGLAASQIGEPVQLFVMDSSATTTRDRLFVFINPEITQQSRWKYCREGCLSFPDYLVTVKRAKKMEATWLTPENETKVDEFNEFEAIIFQHEFDHLKGILFIDRLQNPQTDLILRSKLT